MQRNNKIILDQLIKDKPEVIPLIDKYIDMDNIIIKISSGNSILLISNVVMKVYLGEDQTIIEKTKKIYSNLSENLPKLYYCENNIIIMEKLNTIFEKKLLIVDFTNVRKVLMEAAIVLRFFHINGFTHGDPSVHNIGFSSITNTYLFYDLDDTNETTDDSLFCKDKVDLLESFQIFVSKDIKEIIANILNDFNKFTKQQIGVKKKNIGRKVRYFPIYKYTYNPDLLMKLLDISITSAESAAASTESAAASTESAAASTESAAASTESAAASTESAAASTESAAASTESAAASTESIKEFKKKYLKYKFKYINLN